MPVNFRLAYNNSLNIVDLFPATNINAINDNDNIMKYSTIDVTIPSVTTQQTTQTISIETTAQQVSAPVYMILNSTGEQAEMDYATINQYQVITNQLIVTRLYSWPQNNIDVTLVFKEAGV